MTVLQPGTRVKFVMRRPPGYIYSGPYKGVQDNLLLIHDEKFDRLLAFNREDVERLEVLP